VAPAPVLAPPMGHDACMSSQRELPRLVIAGAGGVIGRHLLRATEGRYERVVLTRGGTRPTGVRHVEWNPRAAATGDEAALAALARELDGAAALVNLAGSSISAGRLDAKHVATLRSSRVEAGATLSAAAARSALPPPVWFQASGTSIYAEGGESEIDEGAPLDTASPLGEVGVVWEAAATPPAGTRVVTGRMGMVLAPEAEAWRRLLLPIRLFVGGPLGSGRQWWPWIHADDAAGAIVWLLENERAAGVYNLVAEPVRQIELSRGAARRLRRPTLVSVPAFAVRIIMGGLGDPLLLESRRVVPERLFEDGYPFQAPNVEAALQRLLP
jgi:uncharacterized protein